MASDQVANRRHQILRIVIQEYVSTAQPIGSNTIAENYDLGVSAATVRNDLAALEQEGMLTHPHTSAGRIPTHAGYRFFVQNLLAEQDLSSVERRKIRTEFYQSRQEVDQWLRLSTLVLSRTANSAALATAPRAVQSRFKHMELVGIHDTKVLLVLVLEEGTVRQQLLDLEKPMQQEELSRISNELNDRLAHATIDQIADSRVTLSTFAAQVAMLVVEQMAQADNRLGRQIYRAGLVEVLEAPEFAEGENARQIVQVFEERSLLEQVVDTYAIDDDVQVVIAGEGRFNQLQGISIVLSRYGALEQATGILGVVGPLRMSYGRSISAVRFVAALMSEMVEEIYGL